jgi:hypothetical protein
MGIIEVVSERDNIKLNKDNNKKDLSPQLKFLLADDTRVNLSLATKLLTMRSKDIIAVENGLLYLNIFLTEQTHHKVALL